MLSKILTIFNPRHLNVNKANVQTELLDESSISPQWISFFVPWDSSGQIIATSHDLTPNGGLIREIPLFQENLGW